MRDNAVIAHTPTGPVAYVTTRTGFAAHLHHPADVADFTARHPWAASLLADYLQAEATSGRRYRSTGAACTVDEALAMTRQTAREDRMMPCPTPEGSPHAQHRKPPDGRLCPGVPYEEDEPDYGGAFDGFQVTSDADPGL